MKNIIVFISLFLLLFSSTSLIAQVPHAFSFMGVATDSNGKGIANTTINIEIKILQGSALGVTQYSETQSALTNENGLYNLSIGLGQVTFGSFKDINWSNLQMYISLSIDAKGGTDYILAGTTQLLSVPYALKAGEATIKPKISVRSNPYYRPAVVYNGTDYNGQGFITYHYSWIHGDNEDVLVEFKGLPSNINIYTNAMGGYSLPEVIVNTSGVDTIIDGVLERASFLGIADKSIIVPSGKYPLELIFKTKDEILGTLPFDLIVGAAYYDNCFPTLPIQKTMSSNDCTEFTGLLANMITITASNTTEVTVTNIFDNSKIDILEFLQQSNCLLTSSETTQLNPSGYEIINRNITLNANKIEQSIRFINLSTSELKTCYVVYE